MTGNKKNLQAIEKKVENLTEELSRLDYNPEKNNVLLQTLQSKENEHNRLQEKYRGLQQDNYFYKTVTNYKDPEINFDRSRVHGKVIKLFTVLDDKYATAIEMTAGGKLFNVVVDNENTSKLLLNRKCFDQRVYLIPMNKINFKPLEDHKKRQVEQNFPNDAKLAINLIKFDEKYRRVMEYIFGGTFICNNSDIAGKIAYNKSISTKCVNLEGDVLEPGGTMSGGFSGNKENVLLKISNYIHLEERIHEKKMEIIETKEQLSLLNKNSTSYNNKKIELNGLKSELENMNEEKMNEKIKNYDNDIAKFDENIKNNKERTVELDKNILKYTGELEQLKTEEKEEMTASKNNPKNKAESWKTKAKNLKTQLSDLDKSLKKTKKDIEELEFNISDQNTTRSKFEKDLVDEQENLKSNSLEHSRLDDKLKDLGDDLKKLEASYFEEKGIQSINHEELKSLKEEENKFKKQQNDREKELNTTDDKLMMLDKDHHTLEDQIKNLLKEHKWINSEKEFFGNAENEYDFKDVVFLKEKEKLSKLTEENNVLKRKVNMKVDLLADQKENEYNDIVKKRDIIRKDKSNLEKAIEELDVSRREALDKIYVAVNNDINDIYSTLLPGTQARLAVMEGKDLESGLELKVAFNNSWKNSLSELSGGQRSLLALSLILSLLKYKPAPFYILDEIDAALDLSHTQNIGLMIKEHFPLSQFIIVSLKDGMFNNANVLYKVTFVDGASKVQRIAKEEERKKKSLR